jgi:hypothetical protein
MQLTERTLKTPLVTSVETTKLVLLCDHGDERSVVSLIESLSWYRNVEFHVIDFQSAAGRGEKRLTVIPPSWDRDDMQEHSRAAEALWSRCGPNNTRDRVLGYSARIGASLIMVHEQPDSGWSRWWRSSLSEQLAKAIPVLSVPITDHSPFDPESAFRWLLVLDGSPSAEKALLVLRDVARWVPSQVSLLQPLDYAQLWKQRILRPECATRARGAVSMADSQDYLLAIAAQEGAGLVARVLCVADCDSLSAITRLIESDAVDGVALGLSRRSRLSRCLSGEFNEFVFRRMRKPYLLAT